MDAISCYDQAFPDANVPHNYNMMCHSSMENIYTLCKIWIVYALTTL